MLERAREEGEESTYTPEEMADRLVKEAKSGEDLLRLLKDEGWDLVPAEGSARDEEEGTVEEASTEEESEGDEGVEYEEGGLEEEGRVAPLPKPKVAITVARMGTPDMDQRRLDAATAAWPRRGRGR